MKIYDCFMFFNELEILDIRLNTLYDSVDYFVLVESTKSHSGLDKPLYFDINKKRYKKFIDKIIHVIYEDKHKFSGGMASDNNQRNHILNGLKDSKINDIIMISDCDEIPNPEAIKNLMPNMLPCVFKQSNHIGYFNRIPKNTEDRTWMGTAAILNKDLVIPQYVRNSQNSFNKIENGGWHFTYMGGIERIQTKLQNFAHTEYSYIASQTEVLENRLNNKIDLLGRPNGDTIKIDIDEIFPKYILENQEKFKDFIE